MARRESVPPPRKPPGPLALTIHPRLPANWPRSGLGDIGLLARELPSPASLPPGSWVAVSRGSSGTRSWWTWITGRRAPEVHLAVRATALLLSGYSSVCADDQGTAFGQVPRG